MPLLSSIGSNPKLMKSDLQGEYITAPLHLAPSNLSGVNLCPWSDGCESPCLNTAGRGRMDSVQTARIHKSHLYLQDRKLFIKSVDAEIGNLNRKVKLMGKKLAIRLNATSDLLWERLAPDLFESYPDVQFYDYTKAPFDVRSTLPVNYYLTQSMGKSNNRSEREIKKFLDRGRNTAIVFDEIPYSYLGFQVINGDNHDLRFTDPKGVIVGLTAKGKAKHDRDGFVVRMK